MSELNDLCIIKNKKLRILQLLLISFFGLSLLYYYTFGLPSTYREDDTRVFKQVDPKRLLIVLPLFIYILLIFSPALLSFDRMLIFFLVIFMPLLPFWWLFLSKAIILVGEKIIQESTKLWKIS